MQNELSIELVAKLNQAIEKVEELADKLEEGADATDKFSKAGKKLSKAFNFATAYHTAKKLFDLFMTGVDYINDYTENLNLFNVVLDGSISKATKFQNIMAESFGNNVTDQLKYQSLFEAMTESMGLTEEYAYLISENMTKMVYDISSLYNRSQDTVAEALRAGLVGQTKPVRSFGMDITQQSLQPILDELGIEKTVKQLTQVEKQILRYIALLRQSSMAHGDMANTIESPSNQLRVFKNQLVECQKWLSALFIDTFAKILPYANALIMVIKEIARSIGAMLGIEISDYNTGIADTGDYFSDVEDSVDDTTDSVKKLKRELLGFDQINNINEKTDTGNGTDTGLVDPRLLDAIEGYDNGMEKVRMKATKIRDRIMEWLGFTKEIDPLTNEISFKLGKGYSNLKLIGGIIATIVGFKLVKSVLSLITGVSKLGKVLGTSGLIKNLKKIIEYIKTYTKVANGDLLKGITKGTSAWYSQLGVLTKVSLGLAGLVTSTIFAYDAGKDLAEGTENTNSAIGQLVLSMGGAVASGAILGSTFGPLGTTIGAVAGGVIAVVSALSGYIEKVNEVKVHSKVFDEQGISIASLVGHYTEMFNSATKYTGALNDLKIKYLETKNNVASAREEIENFQASLDLQDDSVSQSQLDELANKYDNLKNATESATQASIAYATGMIKAYQSTTAESSGATAKQISNIQALMLAEQGYELEYIDRNKKIVEQYYSGEISASEYQQALYELNVEFGKISEAGVNSEYAIDNFNKKLGEIDYSSPDKLKNSISNVSTEFNNTIDTLESEKDNVSSYWDPMIENANEMIEKFEEIKMKRPLTETEAGMYELYKSQVLEYSTSKIEAINEINRTIEGIQSSYKGFLSSVYADLVADGAHTSKEFNETIKTIETDLNELKDVDMGGFGKELFDSMIQDIINNESTYLNTLNDKFNKYGIEAGNEFNEAVFNSLNDYQKQQKIRDQAVMNGENVVDGYRFGVEYELKTNGAGGYEIGQKAIEETQNCLEIRSPSRKFFELGGYTISGFIEGIKSKEKELTTTVENLLNKIKTKFSETKFSISISSNVESSFNSILSKLENFANKFRSGINTLLSKMSTSMNGIRVGSDNKLYYTSMPYISIPRFANGGFPEDGLFYANHNELVGQFNNGKTAVANNEQITEGIKRAVMEGMNIALAGSSNKVVLDIRQDEGIVTKVVEGIKDYQIRTGELPFDVY